MQGQSVCARPVPLAWQRLQTCTGFKVCLRRLIAALLWRPQEVAVKLQFEGMEQRFRSDIRHGE
jgi:hypothetical protein